MDFLKNNIFYVILLVAVLVVAIPSYILASSREAQHKRAIADANRAVGGQERVVGDLDPVSPEGLVRAEEYNKEWAEKIKQIQDSMERADRHLDYDFLVQPLPEGVPPGEEYKAAYNAAYAVLYKRLADAGLVSEDRSKSPLPQKANFADKVPSPDQIRISQKEYWILKEFVDVLTDPECGITRVTSVGLDARPLAEGVRNGPNNRQQPAESTFWIYPASLEVQMDFTNFPVFLQKLASNGNITFVPDGYRISRAFDESELIYVPTVAVTLYGVVWDYISTEFEKTLLSEYRRPRPRGGAAQPAGARRG